jgi:hypothetical protein
METKMRAAPRFDAERTDRKGAVGAPARARALVVADTGKWSRDRSFLFIVGTASMLWAAIYGATLTFF